MFARALRALAGFGLWCCVACGTDAGASAGAAGSSSAGAAGSSPGIAGSSSASAGASGSDATSASADATLSGLTPNLGALIPVFAPNRTSYTLRVPSATKSVTLTPTASNAAASVQVASLPVASGQDSPELKLPRDGTGLDIAISVTAEDALTTAMYKVHVALQAPPGALTVRSVGDSTMANYDPAASPNQRGWMQMFPQFTSGDVTVDNGGINGSSSKSYYSSGSWDIMKNKLNTGDYVFIQFGHNDEKDGGIEGKSNVGTAAWGAYHDFLTKYVAEARALGAIPILFTPVVRLSFAGASLTPIACHDLTGNGTAVGDANYPEAMRDVAKSTHTPLIDLTLASKALAEQYGPTDAKALLYVSTDDTHLQVLGATAYAALAVQALLAQRLFTENLKPTLGLRLAEDALDFGSRYLSTSLDRGFSVLGLGLVPEVGSVTVSAPDGFLVSTGTGAFGPDARAPIHTRCLAAHHRRNTLSADGCAEIRGFTDARHEHGGRSERGAHRRRARAAERGGGGGGQLRAR
jgi:lysophospholipase L1-like esterase